MEPVIYILEPYGGSARRHNGALPHVFYDDLTLTRGDGVFETLLVHHSRPCNLRRHVERFAYSVEQAGLPPIDPQQWIDTATVAAAELDEETTARMTWTYGRGRSSTGHPSAWLVIRDVEPTKNEVACLTTDRGFRFIDALPEWMPQGAKTLSLISNRAALRWAQEHGADDVIFTEGEKVLEASHAAVAVVRPGHKIRIPAPQRDVLESTTVEALMAEVQDQDTEWKVKRRELTRGDLLEAQSVWLISSTRGPVRVTHIDGKKLKPVRDKATEEKFRDLVNAAIRCE